MSEFIKSFRGVKSGEIYPTAFKRGEKCPEELLAAAVSVGAVAPFTPQPPPPPPFTDPDPGQGLSPLSGGPSGAVADATDQRGTAPATSADGVEPAHVPEADAGSSSADGEDSERARLIAQLDQGGISYDKRWGVAKLQDALKAGKKP